MASPSTDAQLLEEFTVDSASATPPFRQLHDAVVRGIDAGRLHPGQRLPTTRALAAHLGLAVNTVAGAYRALEEAGIVEGRGRAGTFVSLDADPVRASARRIVLDAATRLRDLGLTPEQSHALLVEAVETLEAG